MHFGVLILPDASWSVARERWQSAERMGFDHAWTYDHMTWRSLRDGPWFAAMPTLVAAAVATSHLRLGMLVASPTFRHPVTFAKELMTLDDISDGRVIAGIGAGGDGFDATALRTVAWSRRERTERFEEFVAMLDRLLTEPTTSFKGRYYVANEARAIPGCRQQPACLSRSRRRDLEVCGWLPGMPRHGSGATVAVRDVTWSSALPRHAPPRAEILGASHAWSSSATVNARSARWRHSETWSGVMGMPASRTWSCTGRAQTSRSRQTWRSSSGSRLRC